MDSLSTVDILLGVFYITAALSLILSAYVVYVRRYKRAKLKAISTVSLITSKDNVFSRKTRFLIVSPEVVSVKIDLLNEKEEVVQKLIETEVINEELPFDFDPTQYDSGKYYLSLVSENTRILRAITIAN